MTDVYLSSWFDDHGWEANVAEDDYYSNSYTSNISATKLFDVCTLTLRDADTHELIGAAIELHSYRICIFGDISLYNELREKHLKHPIDEQLFMFGIQKLNEHFNKHLAEFVSLLTSVSTASFNDGFSVARREIQESITLIKPNKVFE